MIKTNNRFENNETLILRDFLALERTRLANVRTLFAYVRTSLYLLTAGIGILQIESISRIYWIAWTCILSCIILFFMGFYRFWKMKKQLDGFGAYPEEVKK